jgi:hypothetical protein
MNERLQSPVDIVTGIREDLAKFRRISDKQELRMTIREVLRDGLLQAVKENVLALRPGIHPVVDHFRQQGLVAIDSETPDAA